MKLVREFDCSAEPMARQAAREYRVKGYSVRVVPLRGYGGPFWRVKLYPPPSNKNQRQFDKSSHFPFPKGPEGERR